MFSKLEIAGASMMLGTIQREFQPSDKTRHGHGLHGLVCWRPVAQPVNEGPPTVQRGIIGSGGGILYGGLCSSSKHTC